MDSAGHNNFLLVEAYYLLLGEIYYVVNMLEEISLHNSDSFKVVFIDNITCLIVLPSSLYIYPQMICEGGCCGQQIQRQSVLGGLIDSTLLSFHITIVMNTRVSIQFKKYEDFTGIYIDFKWIMWISKEFIRIFFLFYIDL